MISISLDQWIDIREELLDDSAGPIDDPDWFVIVDLAEFDNEFDDHVTMEFKTPEAEMWFKLKYIKE